MNWVKRLFRRQPKATPEYEIISGPFAWFVCGMRIDGQPTTKCINPDCKICYPMTRERAAVINERFLSDRKCRNKTCCGSCPGGCVIGIKP